MSEGSVTAQIMAPNGAIDYWAKFNAMSLGEQLRHIAERIRKNQMGGNWETPGVGSVFTCLKLEPKTPSWYLAQRQMTFFKFWLALFDSGEERLATLEAIVLLASASPEAGKTALETLP